MQCWNNPNNGGVKKLRAITGMRDLFKEYRPGAIRKEINRLEEKLKDKESWNQRKKGIHGIQVARRAPNIMHFFFVDDNFLFYRTTSIEVDCIMATLKKY